MKKITGVVGGLALAATLALTGCAVTSHTETAKGADFSRYKTFAWAGDTNVSTKKGGNDIVDDNIKNAIDQQLQKKGWRESADHPDILLDYNIAVQVGQKRESNPMYSYPYTRYIYTRRGIYSMWYPSMLMGYNSYNVPFREGQLTVNMIDAKTNKLVWTGWAEGEITRRQISSKEAEAQVKSIFKKFDYPTVQG